ncbi:MAG TPA: type VI secretion system ATPase TssH [Rhodothermales bacterium]|nr:type VI secretion system ATPase TssH [Rhodothermales bacterium]
MTTKDLKKLLKKLDDHLTRALEAAAGFCISRGHYEVTLEHLLLKLLEEGTGDIPRILEHYGVASSRFWEVLLSRLEDQRTGNTGRPSFSPRMLQLVEDAWVIATVHHDHAQIRSGHLLEALLQSEAYQLESIMEVLSPIKNDDLREHFIDVVAGSVEEKKSMRAGGPPTSGGPARSGEETALDLYTVSVTGNARDGKIDPVFARDKEIRQIIDILSRRRKNNPILVGEAGVGKTAVVEGLAMRLAAGDVPDSLKDVEIRSLDLGLLQAGAGVKGEFENRLKSVIQEVREAPKPTIMFIDEAHTLIGAGGSAGTSDAANLLKPALARGELRTIAATTWSEYKKYIEKDPALERRFQMVKIDPPSVEDATVMLRGIKPKYEDHHDVQITDEALFAAAGLSDRYVAGRQLPDKAVDLLDTASARVKMTQSATPAAVDALDRRLLNLGIEIKSLQRDLDTGLRHDEETLQVLKEQQAVLEADRATLAERWGKEQKLALRVEKIRSEIAKLKASNGQAEGTEDSVASLREELDKTQAELFEVQVNDPMVHPEVNKEIIAQVIADWTGIPVGDMLKDEAATLLELENRLTEIIKGQDEAINQIADSIRSAKAGMGNPDAPLAVFMLVGPSGVGKTETARTLAELMFGGEKFLTSINMSEYQEAHTVSQLKGSPPGYVGFGEGGVLTEAVRQRPYSVVLLDETEKAHIDVMELFYQVFDRGMMRDGEGREIDFRNTIIMMTSNVGSDIFLQVCTEDERPTPDQLRNAIHDQMVEHFQAALLARMKVVPFYPLAKSAMKMITRLKLNKINKRLQANHGMRFIYPDQVVEVIADRCTQVDSGARNIDFIIDRTVLPEASKALLGRMAEEEDEMPDRLVLGINEAGDFTYTFGDEAAAPEAVAPEAAAPEAVAAPEEPPVAETPANDEAAPKASEDETSSVTEEDPV